MKLFNQVCGVSLNVRRHLMAAVATVLALGLNGLSYAAEGDIVIAPIVSEAKWTSVIGDIATAMGVVMVSIIGLAIGLMIVTLLFRVVKKFLFAGK